jgi:hypothetical protein
LANAFTWRAAGGVLMIDVDVAIHGRLYEATLTYPDLFPRTPPCIRPRNPSGPAVGHRNAYDRQRCCASRELKKLRMRESAVC